MAFPIKKEREENKGKTKSIWTLKSLMIWICIKTAYHWEAESGGDYRQDVGTTPCFDQPAKLCEPQRCDWSDERGRVADPMVGREGL